ncbi:hypothetical protein L3Q82_008449, partial [Scortum barcoo]
VRQVGTFFILKLRGTERQLVADDRPLQHLAQLGQEAAEVQFILQRTGPSLSDGPNTPTGERRLPLHRPSEPENPKHKDPHKALTFSMGPSTLPRRTKSNRAWSPSPRSSPEPRASPISFLNPLSSRRETPSSSSSREEVFRHILQQQRRLQDLEIQLEALERETEVWERQTSSFTAPSLSPVSAEELDELERRLRQNEAELMHRDHWEEQLQAEMDRERDMHRRLQQVHLSVDDHSYRVKELQARSALLQQDIQLTAQRRRSRPGDRQPEEALRLLKQELQHRLRQGEELDATLSKTQRKLQAAEERLKDRWKMMEELNKELRQWKLQQFIQQTGGPQTEQTNSLPYLNNAGIME